MPHKRSRHVYTAFLKRLSFFRVVSIQGARQTGKSFLAREILAKENKKSLYLTFDHAATKDKAQRGPDTFILEYEDYKPVILDEAQKVPAIFDAVKLHVDHDTGPGQFVLLGSAEFSKEMHIRESLTGRLGRIRIYPFNLAEAGQKPPNPVKSFTLVQATPRFSRKGLLKYLQNGGFPGIFYIHGLAERQALLDDWLRLVLERDLHQFLNLKVDSELSLKIVNELANAEHPAAAQIAKRQRVTTQKVTRILTLLKSLFVIHELRPHRLGSGKARYLLCDAGLATHLGASRARSLATWLVLEFMSQHAYRGTHGLTLSYYRSARGGIIDFVIENRDQEIAAFKIIDRETRATVDQRELEILRAFKIKCIKDGYKKVFLYALAPVNHAWTDDEVSIIPWESIG